MKDLSALKLIRCEMKKDKKPKDFKPSCFGFPFPEHSKREFKKLRHEDYINAFENLLRILAETNVQLHEIACNLKEISRAQSFREPVNLQR